VLGYCFSTQMPCRFQRLLAHEYDRKLKEAQRKGKTRFSLSETVDGEPLAVNSCSDQSAGSHSSPSPRGGSGRIRSRNIWRDHRTGCCGGSQADGPLVWTQEIDTAWLPGGAAV
jgi:hypothetical protein